jgi:hypothetical protein
MTSLQKSLKKYVINHDKIPEFAKRIATICGKSHDATFLMCCELPIKDAMYKMLFLHMIAEVDKIKNDDLGEFMLVLDALRDYQALLTLLLLSRVSTLSIMRRLDIFDKYSKEWDFNILSPSFVINPTKNSFACELSATRSFDKDSWTCLSRFYNTYVFNRDNVIDVVKRNPLFTVLEKIFANNLEVMSLIDFVQRVAKHFKIAGVKKIRVESHGSLVDKSQYFVIYTAGSKKTECFRIVCESDIWSVHNKNMRHVLPTDLLTIFARHVILTVSNLGWEPIGFVTQTTSPSPSSEQKVVATSVKRYVLPITTKDDTRTYCEKMYRRVIDINECFTENDVRDTILALDACGHFHELLSLFVMPTTEQLAPKIFNDLADKYDLAIMREKDLQIAHIKDTFVPPINDSPTTSVLLPLNDKMKIVDRTLLCDLMNFKKLLSRIFDNKFGEFVSPKIFFGAIAMEFGKTTVVKIGLDKTFSAYDAAGAKKFEVTTTNVGDEWSITLDDGKTEVLPKKYADVLSRHAYTRDGVYFWDPYAFIENPDATHEEKKTTSQKGHQCTICKTPTSMMCMRCRKVYYCGVACQTKDWKSGHSKVCAKKS